MSTNKIGIHIFRRDMRLPDNNALHLLSQEVDYIIPIFIFDPFQVKPNSKNKSYRSCPAINLMIECLLDLNSHLNKKKSQLYFFYGKPEQVLDNIIKLIQPSHVSYNADFSKYSIERDALMDEVCNKHQVNIIKYMNDLTLNNMEYYLNPNNNSFFKVFGSYYKNAIKIPVRKAVPEPGPNKFIQKNKQDLNSKYYIKNIGTFIKKLYDSGLHNKIKGGRTNAELILDNIKQFGNYEQERNNLHYNTSCLSGYLKFGCVSLVETYHAMHLPKNILKDLIKQLYWRQYFFILAKYNYNNYNHQDEFFKNIKWKNDIQEARLLWDKAQTGFPAIDAAVRQLLKEGYMHNRGRLIVSNFAVKILQQDPFNWKTYGGQFVFSRLLYDNCYANNYGNWNFTLGPYDLSGFRFGKGGTRSGRLINPINFKKWDPELLYVRKYIPELASVPDRDVFNWYTAYKKYPEVDYPGPCLDYNKRKEEWYKITKV
jgi:deoxyribodipyrimidine photo-lyase